VGGGDYYRVRAVLSHDSMVVLKAWEELAEIASWGTEFHRRMVEGKKDCLWDSVREWGIWSLVECPLVLVVDATSLPSFGIASARILYIMVALAAVRRCLRGPDSAWRPVLLHCWWT